MHLTISTYLDGALECSVEVDLDGAVPDVKVHLAKVERDCRIFHLNMDMTNHESGTPIELGCSCNDDLAATHKQCAEAWFKIKGNKRWWRLEFPCHTGTSVLTYSFLSTNAGKLSSISHGSARTSATPMRSASMSLSWRGCFRCRRSARRSELNRNNPSPRALFPSSPNPPMPDSIPVLFLSVSPSLLSIHFI
ncbi:Zinc finger, RING-CH-type [Sesbania bispinosa]|nr:Zinc finger, RING-CH-type [Sesbania bispinosa]